MNSSIQSHNASQKHQNSLADPANHGHHTESVFQNTLAVSPHQNPRFDQAHDVPHANSAFSYLSALTPISFLNIINQPDLLQKFNDTKRKEKIVGDIFYYRLSNMDLLQILYQNLS